MLILELALFVCLSLLDSLEFVMDTLFHSPGSIFVGMGENRLGSKYKKVVYREYTDATFSTMKQRQTAEKYLGILGWSKTVFCKMF